MMISSSPSIEHWRELFKAAIEFKQLECWRWLTDQHIFGVQNPKTGEIGYCCVLGFNEEMYGLTVNIGRKGFAGILKMQSDELLPGDTDVMYMQNCLMVSFNDRNFLEAQDLKMIKKLGLKFRGSNAWPNFRSYEPGYFPWQLTTIEQIEYLTVVLQQAVEVAKRYSYPLITLFVTEKGEYLTRIAENHNGSMRWSDEWLKPHFEESPEEAGLEQFQMDELRLNKFLKTVKARTGIWEIDSFYFPTPINEGGRPFYPKLCLFLDQDSGQILHFHMSDEAGDAMNWGEAFIQIMEKFKIMPKEVWFRNERHLNYIEAMLKKCKIAGKIVAELPSLQEAKEGMFQ